MNPHPHKANISQLTITNSLTHPQKAKNVSINQTIPTPPHKDKISRLAKQLPLQKKTKLSQLTKQILITLKKVKISKLTKQSCIPQKSKNIWITQTTPPPKKAKLS